MSDQEKNEISRRDVFARIGLLLNGLAVAVLAVPVVGYLVSPVLGGDRGQYKRWITLGELDEFPEGQTRLAGPKPINTSGGLKSKGHPVGATGVAQLFEVWLQLKGRAGKRQVPNRNLRVGGAHNLGGTGGTCTFTILERR